MGEDITLEGWAGIMIDYNAANAAYGVEVNLDGTVSSLKDDSGAYGHAVYINGTVKQAEGTVPVININPGAKVNAEGNSETVFMRLDMLSGTSIMPISAAVPESKFVRVR